MLVKGKPACKQDQPKGQQMGQSDGNGWDGRGMSACEFASLRHNPPQGWDMGTGWCAGHGGFPDWHLLVLEKNPPPNRTLQWMGNSQIPAWQRRHGQCSRPTSGLHEMQPSKTHFTSISTFQMVFWRRKYHTGGWNGKIPKFKSFPVCLLCFSFFHPSSGGSYEFPTGDAALQQLTPQAQFPPWRSIFPECG